MLRRLGLRAPAPTFVGLSCLALFLGSGSSVGGGRSASGAMVYSPSRTEWLVVELNACCRIPFGPNAANEFDISFIQDESDPDAVILRLYHSNQVDRGHMN